MAFASGLPRVIRAITAGSTYGAATAGEIAFLVMSLAINTGDPLLAIIAKRERQACR